MSKPLLSFEGVSINFGGIRALKGLTMQVERGSIHALIGPNGAGKSTAFNCISRFYRPSEGEITFDGVSLIGKQPHEIVGLGIARTFQNVEVCPRMTVLENVLVGMTSRIPRYFPFGPGRARLSAEREALRDAEELLERAALADFRDVLAEELDFGRQKMLDVTRALASKPRLLLLDEPAAGLRNREIAALDEMLLDLVSTRGLTIVLVEHVMQLVMSVADRITVLNFGEKIAEGRPAEIRRNERVVEAYLGRDVHVEA